MARLEVSCRRRIAVVLGFLAVAMGALLAGCGGSSSASTTTQHAGVGTAGTGGAAGSAQGSKHKSAGHKRAVARRHKAATTTRTRRASAGVKTDIAGSRALNPCTLVTKAQAQSIVGATLRSEKEAPLGPTCIFTFAGRRASITLAIESLNYAKTVRPMRKPTRLTIRGFPAECGTLGTQMLFVSLSGGKKVMNVTAPCPTAEAFARTALPHLHS